MSGFQDIAAAIGVAEVAFRSISRIYEFVKDLQDAPEAISRLAFELRELTQCFVALRSAQHIDQKVFESFDDIGVPHIVNRCGTTCAKLQENLEKWSRGGIENLYTRIRFRFNKTRIQGVTEEIGVAKQTLTLAVTISIHIRQDNIIATMSTSQVAAWVSKDQPSKQLTPKDHASRDLTEKDLARQTTQLYSDKMEGITYYSAVEKSVEMTTSVPRSQVPELNSPSQAKADSQGSAQDVHGHRFEDSQQIKVGVLRNAHANVHQNVADTHFKKSTGIEVGVIEYK